MRERPVSELTEKRLTNLQEAERVMSICNACRYCEGLCAVFPAMEKRISFAAADLNYLANLCHECSACYYDCQHVPPHEFAIDVPRALSAVRADSYAEHVWPKALAPAFNRNGLTVALLSAAIVTLFIIVVAAVRSPQALITAPSVPGNFYAVLSHDVMLAIFLPAFLIGVLGLAIAARNFWKQIAGPDARFTLTALSNASRDAATLRNLEGGGGGCMTTEEKPDGSRRLYHHFTFYGFLLCFAATSVATIYHYAFGLQAPYDWNSLPVVLGTLGGLGLLIGPAGLLRIKIKRVQGGRLRPVHGLDVAFLSMLFLTSATGLALLFLRGTAAMGLLLAIHLGVVFALFITMPYSKFVHGFHRMAALVRYALEKRH